MNLQIINPFFGASDPQICKSQNLTFCVPDVPPKFVVLLTSTKMNTPPAAGSGGSGKGNGDGDGLCGDAGGGGGSDDVGSGNGSCGGLP